MKIKFYTLLTVLSLAVLDGADLLGQKTGKTALPAAANYKKPLVKSLLGKISEILNSALSQSVLSFGDEQAGLVSDLNAIAEVIPPTSAMPLGSDG